VLLQFLINQTSLAPRNLDWIFGLRSARFLRIPDGLLPMIDQPVSGVDVLRKQLLAYLAFTQHSRIIGRSVSSRKVQ
jgi:hypothetical protein